MSFFSLKSIAALFLSAAIAHVVQASDILHDGYRDALALEAPLSASPSEQFKTEAMLDFAKAFSFKLFDGTAPLRDADRFLAALERDPSSEQLISFYLNMFRKSPDRAAALEKLYALANRHPKAWALHLTVAELLVADKKKDEALRHLKQAFEHGVLAARDHNDPAKERLRLAILSKYLLMSYLEKKTDDFKTVESFLRNDPFYRNHPGIVANLMILASAKVEQAPPVAPTPFGPLPGPALDARVEFHQVAKRFMEKVRAGEMPPAPDRTAAVNLLFHSGFRAEMEEALKANQAKNPKEIDTYLRLADLAKLRGDLPLAAKQLEAASQIESAQSALILKELLPIYADALKNYDLALRTLDRMRAHVPLEKLIPLYILVYRKRGEPGKALQIIRSLPESFQRYFQETLFLHGTGNFKGAYEAAGKAYARLRKQKLELREELFFFLYAELAEKQNDLKTVAELMESLIRKNPEHHEAKNFLGYVLADHNLELEKAYKLIDEALRAKPESRAYLDSMAWVLYRMKKFPEAKAFILKSLKDGKDDAVMLDHAGDIHFALNDKAAALDFWKRALRTKGNIDRKAVQQKIRNAEDASSGKP